MSLKVDRIQYDTVNLSTLYDLELFTEDLKLLILNGYSATLSISATNFLKQDSWEVLNIPLQPRKRYDYDQRQSYNISSSTDNTTM